MENLCKCNNCDNLFIDTNPQANAKLFHVAYLGLNQLENHKCPICNTDAYLQDEIYKDLLEILIDIPCNESCDDEIEEQFLHFAAGTSKFEIWHWFEDEFNIPIAKDLSQLIFL